MTKSGGWKNGKVVRYLRDTRLEMRKVHWPTRAEAWSLTKIVLAVTVAMSLLLGVLDYLFAMELAGLVTASPIAIGVLAVLAVGVIVAVVLVKRQAVR